MFLPVDFDCLRTPVTITHPIISAFVCAFLRSSTWKCKDKWRSRGRLHSDAQVKHSSKLKPHQFQVADLVMRKVHPYQLENKLSPKWTDPFRIIEALGNGAYRLETLEGGAIPRTWNATNLKFYFNWTLALYIILRGCFFFLIRIF